MDTKKLIESVKTHTVQSGMCDDVTYVEKSDFDRVVDELTKWNKVDEITPINQDIVLVRSDNGSVCTAYWCGDAGGFITYGDDVYVDFGEIIEWRYIF